MSETTLSRREKRQQLDLLRKKLSAEGAVAKRWQVRLKRAFGAYMKAVARCERMDRQIEKLEAPNE